MVAHKTYQMTLENNKKKSAFSSCCIIWVFYVRKPYLFIYSKIGKFLNEVLPKAFISHKI